MDKQLNFINIFEKNGGDQDISKEELNKELIDDVQISDDPDVLDNDPIEFDLFEKKQKEEAERLTQEMANSKRQIKLKTFLEESRGKINELDLSDFSPFLIDLQKYHERFQLFKKQYEEAVNGSDKENIYKKIVSPETEDEPEFRDIAALYRIYIKKFSKHTFSAGSQVPHLTPKEQVRPKIGNRSEFWSTPKTNQGKDAAAGSYLEEKE